MADLKGQQAATESGAAKSITLDDSLDWVWGMWRKLELYRLLFGDIDDHYGKVDTLLAFRTYKEKESFHQNFGRYMEALRAKLEVTDLESAEAKATTE